MKIFKNFFKGDQKLNAQDIAVEIEANKFQRLDKYLKKNIVYNQTLSGNQSSVSIPCDAIKDGGVYEFIFIIIPNSTSQSSDYKMYFNDDRSITYAENMLGVVGSLIAEGNLTQYSKYRGFQSLIGDYWASSGDKKKPIVLEGKIILQDNIETNGKVIFVETKFMRNNHASQCIMFHSATSTSDVTNITKINLVQTSNNVNNYGVGSRFILKRCL